MDRGPLGQERPCLKDTARFFFPMVEGIPGIGGGLEYNEKNRNTLLVQAVMAAMLFAGNLIWNEVHFISYQDMHYYNMAFSGIFLGLALGLLLQNRNRAEQ